MIITLKIEVFFKKTTIAYWDLFKSNYQNYKNKTVKSIMDIDFWENFNTQVVWRSILLKLISVMYLYM